MHPMPLRGPKIAAILKAAFTQLFSRSIGAARVMGNPFSGEWATEFSHRRLSFILALFCMIVAGAWKERVMPDDLFPPERVAEQSRRLAQALIMNTLALLKEHHLSAREWFSAGRQKYTAEWEEARGAGAYNLLRVIAMNATAVGATVVSFTGDAADATLTITDWPDPWFLTKLGLTIADTDPFWEALRTMIEYLGFEYQWQRENQCVILRVRQPAG
jgi:hypothetical protein